MSADFRILSRPIKLHWAGWETDTFQLQQAGWSLSAEQDFYRNGMRIAMRHRGCGIYGLTDAVSFQYEQEFHSHRGCELVLPVRHMASRLQLQLHQTGIGSFQAIDAQPQIIQATVKDLEDLAHFAVPLARTQEVILPEADIPELLERILNLQQPARTARLKAELREERLGSQVDPVPRQRFHAQILSLAA